MARLQWPCAVFVVFAAIGLARVVAGSAGVRGWIVFIGSLCFVVPIVAIGLHPPTLTITGPVVTYRWLATRRRHDLRRCSRFEAIEVRRFMGSNSFVVFDDADATSAPGWAARSNRHKTGRNAWIPAEFGPSPEQLAAELNRRREIVIAP
jgi:hypothetical protein